MSSNAGPSLSTSPNFEKIIPPKHLMPEVKRVVFDHLFCQLASFRNTAFLYADLEARLSGIDARDDADVEDFLKEYNEALDDWAQEFLKKIWVVCCEKEEGDCPTMDPYADTPPTKTATQLPPREDLAKLLNAILFLHLTTSKTKQYSALTRAFFASSGYTDLLDEDAIIWTLKNPEKAVEQAEAHQQERDAKTAQIESIKASHAERSRYMRNVGIGIGTVAGGVLVGITGGLAAPLVGAGLATVLGWFGIGGTVVGLLASGLASSGVLCGALFGAYGAKSTAGMAERYTREVRDLDIVPVRTRKSEEDEVGDTLAVRLCVSGWLKEKEDVTAPWTIFGGDDTYALKWEVEALEELSNALTAMLASEAMKYVKSEVIKRTIFAGLMSSLAPLALLKVGQIVDNPYMKAKALATKTGAVLAELLAKRVFGNRPVTLVGYSLGSLVIHEALLCLAELPPSETIHVIQDVYLFGTPASTEPASWARIRRVVAGRVVNGYAKEDYVLAVLSRASTASWNIAGLETVNVKGVENVLCDDIEGHLLWRRGVGRSLERCNAPGTIAKDGAY